MSGDDYIWHYDYARLAFDTGFNFEIYRSKSLDKIIGPINVDHIIRDRDVATIEKYIPAVIEFCLDNDQTSVLDPTFVKVFQLSQLSVQYLLFCKRYLDNSVVLIKQEYQKGNEENKNLKRQVDELCQEASNYKKQIKELKASLNTQIAVNQNSGIFQCQECPKAFSTEDFLLAHIKRRHESLGIVVAHSNTAFQAETDKLQLEIKQLKERLNNTERFVSHNEFTAVKEYSSKPNTEQNAFVSELQEKFEHLKTHVDSELRILQTQKFEKEKYEKWFETFLTNKLNIVSNLNEKPTTALTTTTGTQGEIIANNCSTQTESLVLSSPVTCETCQNRDLQKLPSGVDFQYDQENNIKNQVFCAEELQERFHLEAQNRLQKFEELLEERVTGSIEKLENQMQTFLVKINDIEEHRAKTKLNTSIDSFQEVVCKAPKPRKQTVRNKNTTSQLLATSKSADQIDNIGPLPKSSINNKSVASSQSANSVVIKKFCSSSSESEEESESNESEIDGDNHEVVINKPVVKISATSTLGRRSLASLKEAAFTPTVLSQLQKEVEKVMQNRLLEIGVDPKSNGISVRHYQRALGLVSHQASVIQKNVSNYMQIRRHIMKDVESKATEHSKTASKQNSKLKTLLSSFRRSTITGKSPQKVVTKPPIPQIRNIISDDVKMEVNFSEIEAISPHSNRSSKLPLQNPLSANLKNQTSRNSTDSDSILSLNGSGTSTRKPLVDQTDLINDTEAQTKGVLKNYPTSGSLPKKKVIFDLDSASKENIKPVTQTKTAEGGSTTSIASSTLDGSKAGFMETLHIEKKKQEAYDSSDWELSEVSTN